ncbi:MAG: ammonium transporter, partial [Chitinophagaceae bacterium]
TVVHISAGTAGLVAAHLVGPRQGYGRQAMPPHNLPFNLTGAALLWIGWFGFNGGSALAANEQAVLAVVNTMMAAVCGVLVWLLIERVLRGKASLLGAVSGAIAGLVGITPAAGLVAPSGALVIGALAAWAAFYGVNGLKRLLGVDDAFDVFGIHAVGGIVGALLTGIFQSSSLGGAGPAGVLSILWQTWLQTEAVVISIIWAGVVAALAVFVANGLIGLRASADQESVGMDQSDHGENAYPMA